MVSELMQELKISARYKANHERSSREVADKVCESLRGLSRRFATTTMLRGRAGIVETIRVSGIEPSVEWRNM